MDKDLGEVAVKGSKVKFAYHGDKWTNSIGRYLILTLQWKIK